MLTTYDLYKRPGYSFEIDDLVKFKLLRRYRLNIFYDDSKRGVVKKSNTLKGINNKNLNQTITGTVINYKPNKISDLEIELIGEEGCEIILKLSQCKDLEIIS